MKEIKIVRVISKIPEEKLLYLCDIGDNNSITLSELIKDYLFMNDIREYY